LLTGEQAGYYQDFGTLAHLGTAWSTGYVYTGQYSPYRQRRHGHASYLLPAHAFVVCSQNHDQVGNRMLGERLGQLVNFEHLKLAASVVLLSPYIPLLFMGEEYGETAPFYYFISHFDPGLVAAVQHGRREEFAAFQGQGEPPDPQAEGTFWRSKLDHTLRDQEPHQTLLAFTHELIRLRTGLAALAAMDKETMEIVGYEKQKVLYVRRWCQDEEVVTAFHFGETAVSLTLPIPAGHWHKRLDSAEEQWQGRGSALPLLLPSPGEVHLTLPPTMAVLFGNQAQRET